MPFPELNQAAIGLYFHHSYDGRRSPFAYGGYHLCDMAQFCEIPAVRPMIRTIGQKFIIIAQTIVFSIKQILYIIRHNPYRSRLLSFAPNPPKDAY